MKKTSLLLVLMLVLSLITFVGCGSPDAPVDEPGETDAPEESAPTSTTYLSIGTGGVAGVYYPLGGAVASIINNNVPGYNCTAEATGGSVENVMLIRDGNIDLGFIDASNGYNAQNSFGTFDGENVTNLKALTSTYFEAVQVISVDPDLKTIEDLRGKRVAVGSAGSGTEVMARDLLALYGMTYDDIQEDYLGFGDASMGLKDRTLDAAIIWAGVPTSGILELGATNDISMMNFTDDMVEKLKESHPFAVSLPINDSVYSSLVEPVQTIAVPAAIFAAEELSDDFVYDFLTAFFNNLDVMAGAHARGGDISLDTALDGLSEIDLHSGAIRFYEEHGML